ncbi:MAG: Na/Pi cotransporter family protein [Treponema sp.]|nr:Na/Pi cotransporter family protein [Treponema sp.]
MNIIATILQLVGSLAFLLFGMKMLSDGIQKSAGSRLQAALSFMTGNRLLAFITGLVLTFIIQSSGATTAMEVSFVNAGLMTVKQSVGVTLGANVGTTITAWLVVFFGFNFKISAFAVPIFGLGYIITLFKKWNKQSLGEAIMGFGMLFIGLSWLSDTIDPDNGTLNFLRHFADFGVWSILIGIIVGMLITALIHSSSAETAIVITMAYNRLIPWEFAAALVIGSNIGSTIDAVLASLRSSANAKRTALVHVLFNVAVVLLVCIFFNPFLDLIDAIVPGTPETNITYHIAALHTVLKTIAALLCLPFTGQIAWLMEKLIPEDPDATPTEYVFEFNETAGRENATSYIVRVEKEIQDMTVLVTKMFEGVSEGFKNRDESFIEQHMEELTRQEDYADQMKEKITRYLVSCSHLPMNTQQLGSLSIMQQIVDDLEEMTDDCYNVALLLKKSIEKNMEFAQEDMERLDPYMDLARQSMYFVSTNINKHLEEDKLIIAREIEAQIDVFRHTLKKVARKRLEAGANVKSELLYIDLVRQIEKFGDRAYSIANALSEF